MVSLGLFLRMNKWDLFKDGKLDVFRGLEYSPLEGGARGHEMYCSLPCWNMGYIEILHENLNFCHSNSPKFYMKRI